MVLVSQSQKPSVSPEANCDLEPERRLNWNPDSEVSKKHLRTHVAAITSSLPRAAAQRHLIASVFVSARRAYAWLA